MTIDVSKLNAHAVSILPNTEVSKVAVHAVNAPPHIDVSKLNAHAVSILPNTEVSKAVVHVVLRPKGFEVLDAEHDHEASTITIQLTSFSDASFETFKRKKDCIRITTVPGEIRVYCVTDK